MTNRIVNKFLRWGFFGAGKCTHGFVSAIKGSNRHKPIGIASRDVMKAKKFADGLSIPKYYGGYENLAKDPDIDVIYVGTVNSEHFGQAILALENGKHVLCEKPICISAAETKELVRFAREKSLFLMEGFWVNCFPGTQKLREEVKEKSVGEIVHMQIDIGDKLSQDMDRMKRKDLGGGVILNHGVYGIMLSCLLLGQPHEISAKAIIDEETGVEESAVLTLSYRDKRQMSTIVLSNRAMLPGEVRITGTQGDLKIPRPCWAPQKLETPRGVLEFEIPIAPKGSTFYYQNAEGLIYEADEVYRCITQGLLESPLVPHELSIRTMEVCDEARRQIRVKSKQ